MNFYQAIWFKLQTSFQSWWPGLAALGLGILWIWVARQILLTVIYLSAVLINSEFRPPGWYTGTLAGIYRCGVLIMGSSWLMGLIYSYHHLNDGQQYQEFGLRLRRLVIGTGIIYGLSVALPYLL